MFLIKNADLRARELFPNGPKDWAHCAAGGVLGNVFDKFLVNPFSLNFRCSPSVLLTTSVGVCSENIR